MSDALKQPVKPADGVNAPKPEVLAPIVADAIKETLGMTPKEFRAMAEDNKRLADQLATVKAERDKDVIASNGETKSQREYRAKARHVISSDPIGKGQGLMFARVARARALARLENRTVQDVLLGWGDKAIADDLQDTQKALSSSVHSAGGALVPPEYVAEVIEFLRSKAVVRSARGVMPMVSERGTLEIPRGVAGVTAAYSSENANISTSDQQTGSLTLASKKLTSATAVSNDLLRMSDPSADLFVRNDLANAMASREDLAFIRGDGSAGIPRGFRYSMHSGNRNLAAGSTLALKLDSLKRALRGVMSNNIPVVPGEMGWIMTTRSELGLKFQVDANGNFVFRDEMNAGTLLGWPYYVTNSIPENLDDSVTGSNDETEIYLVAFNQVIIMDSLALRIESFDGGAYFDGSAVQSGISRDQTVIRAISEHDCGIRYDRAAAVELNIDIGWA